MTALSVWAIDGIPEITAGDELGTVIGDALAAGSESPLEDGDILAITSKIVSKAEGRQRVATDREQAITDETVRVVASRAHPGGVTRIVENRLGIVSAAAGVDASNTPDGTILLLPVDPDASAAQVRRTLEQRFGVRLGVIITDTLGRAWRQGQTDAAIGGSGVRLLDDLSGSLDASGKVLEVTAPAVGDEIAAAADLVKGKATGRPVAVVRGLAHLLDEAAPGARSLVRTGPTDMFRLGTDEAWREGHAAALAEQAEQAEPKKDLSAIMTARAKIEESAIRTFESRPRNTEVRKTGKPVTVVHDPEPTREWIVVVPVKGTSESKSRLGDDHPDRPGLALAIALDTVEAAMAAESVVGVLVVAPVAVSTAFDELDALVVIEDEPRGLAAAIATGIETADELASPGRGLAILLGDLPALTPGELTTALAAAAGHRLAMVPDADGTGTVLITAADGAIHHPAFGPGSRQAHAAAGYVEVEVPVTSGLRNDVDTVDQLRALASRLGERTRAATAEETPRDK